MDSNKNSFIPESYSIDDNKAIIENGLRRGFSGVIQAEVIRKMMFVFRTMKDAFYMYDDTYVKQYCKAID